MSEVQNFKNTHDVIGNPRLLREDDLKFRGKRVSEIMKTVGQKKVLTLVKRLISERLETLGIPREEFPNDRIVYLDPMMNCYLENIDFILFRESSEANVGTTIHEIGHAMASEWRYNIKERIEDVRKKNKSTVRSGLSRIFYKDGFNNPPTSSCFVNIDEAITEKIAQELFQDNYDEILTLKDLFTGRCDLVIKGIKKKYDQKRERKREDMLKVQAELWEDIRVSVRDNITLAEQIDELLEKGSIDERAMQRIKKVNLEGLIRIIRSKIDMVKEMADESTFDGLEEIDISDAREDYSFNIDRSSYSAFIQVLDLMIEGVTYSRIDNEDDFEEERKKVWSELQRAYFTGNIMYLRIFDKVYNNNILKSFDEFEKNDDSSTDELIDFLKEKNEKMKMSNFDIDPIDK